MTATDPLATERFRTLLADVLGSGRREGDGYAHNANVGRVVAVFPGAHFEYRTNDNGVKVRRVVVESEWEVDPVETRIVAREFDDSGEMLTDPV